MKNKTILYLYKKILLILLIIVLQVTSFPIGTVFAEAANTKTQMASKLPPIAANSFSFATDASLPQLDLTTSKKINSTVVKQIPIVGKLSKKHFRSDEDIHFAITNNPEQPVTVEVIDVEGKKAEVDIDQTTNITQTTFSIEPRTQFRPGKYRIVVTNKEGFRSEQDFRWGVLAINTNRSIYQPGQTANLSIAVLNDKGEMVCDAKVELKITNTKEDILSTDNGKIATNPQCNSHEFSLQPDYEAQYQVGEKGVYALTLTAQTGNGTYSISDMFSVEESTPFDVERKSSTRIYPPNNYPVNLTVTANQDFEGTITETVPDSFTITPSQTNSYDKAQTVYLEKQDDPSTSLVPHLSPPGSKDVLGVQTSSSGSALLLPFAEGYSITQGFGTTRTEEILSKFYQNYDLSGHDGIDFGIPENTPIFAADDGNVVLADNGDYGVTVVIQHEWGKSYYGHLNKVTVGKDTSITKGTQIGLSGNTGESTGPHLHFGIKPNIPDMENGYFGKVDPLPYFNLPASSTFANNLGAVVTETQTMGAISSAVLSASMSAASQFNVTENQHRKNALTNDNTANEEKVKVIQWHVSLKKGQKTTLGYQFRSPQVSPQFYLLGPLTFYSKNSPTDIPVFQELRHWQIAADAIGDGWYNDGTPYGGYSWLYRKEITTTSNSSIIPSTQPNFPLLVSLTADEELVAKAQTNGEDIVFAGANGTKLDHEIEKYNITGNGDLVAWVEVPSLATNTSVYMYYGNPSASDQQNPTGVWDTNYQGIWHLSENPAASAPQLLDSTSNNNDASSVGSMTLSDQVTGKIDGALDFDGTNDYITAANSTSLRNITNGTFSAWIIADTYSSYRMIMEKGTNDNDNYAFIVLNGVLRFEFRDSGGTYRGGTCIDTTTLTTGNWYHVVMTYNDTGNLCSFYINGNLSSSDATTFSLNTSYTGAFHVGAEVVVSASAFWDGIIDEPRVSNTVRSANWITTEYNNQNSPTTFYTLGQEETKIYSATPDQLMRHGRFFNSSGVIQPFLF